MLQLLDPDLLRTFIMVAETSSFTRASERLFRSQAAISMQIKRLEERIGKPIFVREPHGAHLTSEGELLIHYARRLLRLNDEALANLSVAPTENVVRIGAPDEYVPVFLPEALLLLNKSCPGVLLELVSEKSTNLMQEVRNGRVDLALIMRHPENTDGEVLRREQLHWITSSDNSPHTSRLLPLALLSDRCVRRDIALRTLKQANRCFEVVLSSGSMTAIVAAVSAGLAISVAEDSVMPAGVRKLGEQDELPALGVADLVLHRAPGHQPRAAATLAEHIRLSFRKSAKDPAKCPAGSTNSLAERMLR
ncbi:DNA-binding transcriptional regulator, LysR family [Bradyrhizobium sp. Ghvi]|uniref:LysR substrate-binding domain-containing protein n=1 Tax=Bradyrhizobium sp. Ghvi TaxID=1855319 RepID=UPI0008E0D648|nr:LysR substrate-binding domain-containing protein [Bradyrhizobium sp. Ghvi]SFQ36292.1 DNA-binding transcriptional regulator, LysR family [Bradyrhizobium sp. Ghvi]